MKLKILTVLILCLSFFCRAQQIQFAKIYFTDGYYYPFNFIELPDSGFIINTYFNPSVGVYNNFLFRIDQYGNIIDSITFLPYWDFGNDFTDITLINDTQALAVSGLFNSYYGVNIVKLNINTWDTSGHYNYGNPNQGSTGELLKVEGGYLTCNISAGSYAVMKLDSAFNEVWHSATPYPSHGQLLLDSLNNILVTCEIQNAALQPYAFCYYDPLGGLLWARSYGDNQGGFSGTYINGTIITPDSNFLAFTGGVDWQMMKINHINGDTPWTKQFPNEIYCGLTMSFNNHVICTGYNIHFIDNNGDTLSSKPCPFTFAPVQAHKTKDGGFAICGTKNSGPPAWTQLPVFIKFDSLGNTVSTSIFNPDNNFAPLSFYPNPARDEIFINAGSMAAEKNVVFTLSDMQGRRVLQQPYQYNAAIEISVIPAGLYIATLRGKERELRGKVMVEK